MYVKYSNTQFYVAPRHPERSSSIEKMFNHKKLKCTKESNLNYKNSRVIIVDSFGNLASYFHKSDIVFLGGALSKSGGHNPIEPAKYNCAIISGNHVFNWQNIYDEMVNEKACYIISNIEKLEDLIFYLENQIRKKFDIQSSIYGEMILKWPLLMASNMVENTTHL